MSNNKVVVITGASKGIGRATAIKFANNSYKVYDLSRSGKDDEISTHIYCDVTNPLDIENAINEVIKREGRIDVAISNAGMGISGSVEGHKYEHIKRQIDINFLGSAYFLRSVMKYIRESKGRILFMSSLAADIPIPFQSIYSATKAAIKNMAQSIDNELKGSGARACALIPGDLSTNFTASRIKNEIEDQFYSKRVNVSVAKMEKDELTGKGPEVIAERLYHLATAKNPKVISSVGLFYKSMSVLEKVLPVRFKNWLIYKIYGWLKVNII